MAIAAAVVLAAAVFAADLSLPRGVAGGVPYVGVLILGWWIGPPRRVFALAAVCSILTIFGYLFSPVGGMPWMVLVNRALALAAIWIAAILVHHAKVSEARVRTAKDEAETLAAELRASENQIRTITDNVPILISYVDKEIRYRFNNLTYKDWFGLSPADLNGRRMKDVLGDAAYGICEPHIMRALTGQTVSYQADLPYSAGKARSVQASHVPDFGEDGEVKGFFTIVSDITDQVQAEALLNDAIEALPVSFAIYDKDDRLTLCNDMYREHVFYHLDSAPLGATFEDVIRDKLEHDHYPEAEGRREAWLAERLGRHKKPAGPIEQKHSNGHWYWINEHRTDAGGIVVVSSDITERKRLEGEVIRQERLAALGQLTATVSHELRNPLGVIRTCVFIAHEGRTDNNPRVQRALDRIEHNVMRCNRIIEELLDFTRVSELELEPTLLDLWLESTLSEQELPSEVELRQDFNMAGIDIAIDRDRIRRAVINVFDNACQAMTGPASDGVISEPRILTVKTQATEGRVEIVFDDNGPGIPADIHPKIFEPLFSTKDFGVGLGLPTVKRIMEQHGGGIDIDSVPGQGAQVRLWLPATQSGD